MSPKLTDPASTKHDPSGKILQSLGVMTPATLACIPTPPRRRAVRRPNSSRIPEEASVSETAELVPVVDCGEAAVAKACASAMPRSCAASPAGVGATRIDTVEAACHKEAAGQVPDLLEAADRAASEKPRRNEAVESPNKLLRRLRSCSEELQQIQDKYGLLEVRSGGGGRQKVLKKPPVDADVQVLCAGSPGDKTCAVSVVDKTVVVAMSPILGNRELLAGGCSTFSSTSPLAASPHVAFRTQSPAIAVSPLLRMESVTRLSFKAQQHQRTPIVAAPAVTTVWGIAPQPAEFVSVISCNSAIAGPLRGGHRQFSTPVRGVNCY